MLKMDERLWKQLNQVNSSVNRDKRSLSILQRFGKADWLPVSGEPQEGRALEKARRLAMLGVDRSSMRLALYETEVSERRILLVIESDRGAYALDSGFNEVQASMK